MFSISDKSQAAQSSINSVDRFCDHYKISAALKSAGAYKQKGVPVLIIIKYLISLIYTGKSMFQDMRSETPFAQGFHKDTVYRFLNLPSVNWQSFLFCIAHKIVREIGRLTSDNRLAAFVVDDTFFSTLHAKKTELVSLVHDHAEKGKNKYKWGFRMLSLCWTDGVTLIPLAFRHLASADEKKQRWGCKSNLDKRSTAYRIRREAVSKATEVLLLQLKSAIKSGISAKHVLFDSWFAYPSTIFKINALGLHVTARVKDTTKIKYLVNSEKKTVKEIYNGNKKRCGKSRYLLSVPIELNTDENGVTSTMIARLVFVRNRQKRNEWIALISTDSTLSEKEIIALYGKRWSIEVFFKICKSYLKLSGEFQQLSYDAITAHTAIVMIRYMILAVEKRKQEDPRSLGELFYVSFDEVSDIKFEQTILLIMSLLAETINEGHFGLTDEQMEALMDAFVQKLPSCYRNCLHHKLAA
jgi:hypothetical protein